TDILWSNIFRRTPESSTRALLRQVPVFADLDRRELSALEKILYRREYRPEEVIFRQDEPGVGMFVIERGTVAIVHEPTGRTLTELTDGDFFGEIALLNETPRSAAAIARTPATLYGLFQPELFDLFERDPHMGVKVLVPLSQVLSQRLLRANRQLKELHDECAQLRERLQPPGEPQPTNGEGDGAQDVAVD
ncbi:MAG: cyclic nucleotide-binding domain-containing protein, partial [Rhodothermales bacterium]|nr:cyclic nucleotide-binding domain-containing protein [Rhodothermales bacterium]